MPKGSVAINSAVVDEKELFPVKDEGQDASSETLDSSRPSNGTTSSDPKKRNSSGSAARKTRLGTSEISHSSSPADLANKHDLLTDAELLSSEVVQLLQSQSHNTAAFTSSSAVENTAFVQQSNVPSLDSVDDACFVCGQEGQLLLCDYPNCTRVYHQVIKFV